MSKRQGEILQATLYRISEAAHLATTLDELYSSIHVIITDLIPVKNFYIALYNEATGLCHFPYHVDQFDADWDPLPPEKTLTGYVLRTQKPLLATPEVFDQLVQSGECELIGGNTVDWLGVPLITRQRTLGVLVVQTYPGDSRLGQTDSDILAFVSRQVALVIERKQAEENLRESEQKLYNIIQASPIPTFVIDNHHQVTHWNRALEYLSKIRAEEVLNTNKHWRAFYKEKRPCLADLLVDGSRDKIPLWYASKFSVSNLSPEAYQATDFFPDLDKRGKWLHFTAAVIRNLAGDLTGAVETLTDISEEIMSANALRQSEEQFRLLFERSPVGMSITSLDGRFLQVNQALCNIFGYTENEMLAMKFTDLSFPQENEKNLRLRADALQGKISGFEMEKKCHSRSGTVVYALLHVVLVRNAQGIPLHFITQVVDITERKRTEEELKFRNLILSTQQEASIEGILVVDEGGKVLSANQQFAEIWGIPREILETYSDDLYQKCVFDKISNPEEWLEGVRRLYQQHHEKLHDEIEFVDGRTIERHSVPMNGPDGKYYGRVWYFRDITERKQAERALRESAERFRIAMDTTSDGLWDWDFTNPAKSYNSPGYYRMLGYEPGEVEMFGNHWIDLVHPEDRERVINSNEDCMASRIQGFEMEFRMKTKNGDWKWIYSRGRVVARDAGGKTLRMIGTHMDITERNRSQQSLRESEERFRLAMDATSEGLWDLDVNADGGYYSPGYYQMLGYEPGEFAMTGDEWRARIHPDDFEATQQANMDCIEGRTQSFETECRMRTKSGDWKWILSRGRAVVRDLNGRALRLIGTHMDITERKQREQELEAITTVSSALRSANTHREMLQIALDQTVELFRATIGGLELIDPSNGDSVVMIATGEGALPAGTRIPIDKGLNSVIRSSGKAYLDNHMLTNPMALEGVKASGTPAWAGAPMIAQGELIGFLWIGRKTDILQSELRPLSAIADITANALRRHKLFEQTEIQLRRLAALRKIDTAISSSQNLKVVIGTVLEQTMVELHTEAACVYQLIPDLLTLECIDRQGFRFPASQVNSLAIYESPAARAILEKSLVQIPDLARSEMVPAALGREDFISYFALPLIAKGQVKGLLEVYFRKTFAPDREWLDFFEILAGQAAIAIDNVNLFQGMQRSNMELSLAYDATIEGWSRVLDLRDKETEGHSQRVTDMTIALAVKLGVRGENLVHVRRGALLHDIGKMGVPDRILLKPDKLTDEEWAVMRKHPEYAYNMLSSIDYLRPALDIPYCHHEKWDGSGYPRGLKGEQIPLAARIFAVVDIWDALLSDRPYRKSWSKEQALQYIQEQQGLHLDPRVVKAFLTLVNGD